MDRLTRKLAVDRKIVELLTLGQSFNAISETLKVGKRRVRKIHDQAKVAGYLDGTPLPAYPAAIFESLGPAEQCPASDIDRLLLEHLEWIRERKEVGWHSVTILEELPVKVSSSSFYRFLQRHQVAKEKCHSRVVPEIIHAPGESLILDWGKLCDVVDPLTNKKRTLWFLVGVMGHSRLMLVRLVWDNKLETTLLALESMFNELGGIPQKLTSDNPKCFATEASKYEPLLNPGFERFCAHYGVVAELLPPYDPEKKGKVERMVPYVRRLYEAHGEFESLESSQSYLAKKLVVANERKHGTTRLQPLNVFLESEAGCLRDLPATSFTPEEYHQGVVRRDGHVRFRGKYYSLEAGHVGKEVFLIGTNQTVEIFFKGKLLETHARIHNPYQSKSTKKSHLKRSEQLMQEHGPYLERAKRLGPYVREMVRVILERGNGFMDLRAIWGVLNLDKDFGGAALDVACQQALECDQLSYRSVQSFLRAGAPQEKMIKKSAGNKFVREMEQYKQLELFS